MAKPEKPSKPGFVIKLSNETAQKLAEEEQQIKSKAEIIVPVTTAEGTKSNTQSIIESKQIDLEVKTSTEDGKDENRFKAAEGKAKSGDRTKVISDDHSTDSSALWGEYAPYVTYEGEEAFYSDPTTKQKYKWNKDTNSWDIIDSTASERVYSYENDTHIYTEPDGSKFFYDELKKAWIPKIDDDFLAFYQMSYGFVDNKSDEKQTQKKEEKPKAVPKPKPEIDLNTGVKRKVEPQWFDASDETNTKVYVSNLPLELTEEEFVEFMQKCGLVERDPSTQKMKVKLYTDKEQNCFKGDALCTYIKVESVELALKLLDGSDLKGNTIKVERAHFQLKGTYNPALKPKKKKKKELEKLKKMQQKLFDWRPEKFIGERSKHERIVIIKNLFRPTDFDNEVQLILDYQQDLREEATKCGEVRKVVIYDRHPEGVAQITMKEPEMADAVVTLMSGRWFGKRQITAEIWDGRTKYRIAETDADISKRIDKWDKFLEGKEEGKSTETGDNILKMETKVTKDTEVDFKVTEGTEVDLKVTESMEVDSKLILGSKIKSEVETISIENKNVEELPAVESISDET